MSKSTLKVFILIFALITALVHLVVLNIPFIQDKGSPDLLFTLNGLGYLGLLAAFFFNIPFLAGRRRLVQYAFIAFTAVTIIAWIPIGARDLVGYGTKLDEVLLIIALILHLRAE
jgi:hypothetical protein